MMPSTTGLENKEPVSFQGLESVGLAGVEGRDALSGSASSGHPYGYFNAEGTEFIVTDPRTQRPFDDFSLERRPFCKRSANRGWLSDYRWEGTKQFRCLQAWEGFAILTCSEEII